MLYLTSYRNGEKFYCSIKFSGDGFEVQSLSNSFWKALLICFVKGLIFEAKLKLKKIFKIWRER